MIRIALTAVMFGLATTACGLLAPREEPAPEPLALPDGAYADVLRETLAQGAAQALGQLGRTNGYWSNAAVRIPLPEPLARSAEALRRLGMGAKVDEFHRALNRAAEQATPYAADALATAIRQMTLDEARTILDGGDGAVTRHFREHSGAQLSAQLEPYVQATTARIGVTQRYKALIDDYAVLLRGADLRELDLDAYVTQKTIDGLFYLMAAEEARIRRDPRARGSELMRQVFGGL